MSKSLLEIISEFSKASEFKLNIKNPAFSLHNNNKQLKSEIFKNLQWHLKPWNYIGLNLTIDFQDIYT